MSRPTHREAAERALTRSLRLAGDAPAAGPNVAAMKREDAREALGYAQVHALLALVDAVTELGAEAYRLRIVGEVMGGEALERELTRTRHPAGTGLEDGPAAQEPVGEAALVVVEDEAPP